jgi:tetratricopeptide (TPR) repeat protein
VPEPAAGDLFARLRQDPEVGRLARSIGLSSRFRFYLLVTATPRVAQAVFAVLEKEVAAEREEPVHLGRLDPYQAPRDPDAPVSFDVLVDEVLAPLVGPSEAMASPQAMVVVDASRALPRDDGAWTLLFQRMNERRNVIAGALRGVLVLALPPRLEPVFAHAAPDFWSIRSLAVVVKMEAPRLAALEGMPEAGEPTRGPVPTSADGFTAEVVAGQVESARERLARNPEDSVAMRGLIVWLGRQVDQETAFGTLRGALAAAEEGVTLARRRLEREPTRTEWLHALGGCLDGLGDVQLALGELNRAIVSHDESLRIARKLVARHPERIEALRDLSVSLEKVGNVQVGRGEFDLALAPYGESLELRRQLFARDPDRVEARRDLSMILDRIGSIQLARVELDGALASYEESLQLRRQAVAHDSEHTQSLHELSVSLQNVGDVRLDRGDLDGAFVSYDESLSTARHVLGREPDRFESLRGLSVSLNKMGDVQLLRGELERALASYREGLQIARQLHARDPNRVEWRHDVAFSLDRQALVEEVAHHPAEALLLRKEALVMLVPLLELPSPLPAWQQHASIIRAAIARLEASAPAGEPPPP